MRLSDLLQLVERDYVLQGRRTLRDARYRWQKLLERLGDLPIGDLTAERLERYQIERLDLGAARSTINNELGLIRRGFVLAQRLGKLQHVPWVRRLTPGAPRSGFLPPQEFGSLLLALRSQEPILGDVAEWLYSLGWRREEVIRLQWDEVDLHAGLVVLPASREKTGRARTVRLTPRLVEILRRRWDERHGPYVFHRAGERLRSFRRRWTKACAAIGRPGLKVHDLRRSFARNALQAGVPQRVIMSVAGWRTASVFHRYAIIDEGQVSQAIEAVADWTRAQVPRPSEAPVLGFRAGG